MQQTFWHDIYSERLLWAENAYQSFIEKFDSDRLINTHLNNKKQASIIIYGSTQVGKTTFILTLLGVDENKISQVDKVLRAGQTLGNSATSRSSRYRRSDDQYWHFSHRKKGEEQFNDEEALLILKELRTQVEKGKTKEISTIDVFIPNIYFILDANHAVDLLIHDLPGINARNKNENSYVKELVGNYISAADMIFLVGKIDGLGFLKNEELDNPLLSAWYFNSTVYKVILTHSFSNASIKDKIINNDINSLESFNDYIFEQINTMELRLPQSIKEQLYPIECGRSWNSLIKGNDKFTERSIQLRKVILNKLYQDIENSMNPLSRLKTGYMLPEYLKQQREKEIEEYNIYIDKLTKEINEIDGKIENKKTYYRKNKNKIEGIKNELDDISKSLKENRKKKKILSYENKKLEPICFQSIGYLSSSNKSVGNLKAFLLNEKQKIIDSYNDWLDFNYKIIESEDNPNKYLNDPLDCFYSIYHKLDDYTIDRYFFDSNYDNDVSSIHSAIKEAQKELFEVTQSVIDAFLNKQKKKKKIEERSISRKIEESQYFITKNEQHIFEKKEELSSVNEVFKFKLLQLDEKISNSRFFNIHIYNSYKKREHELTTLFKKSEGNREKQLSYLFLIRILRKDFLYIKNLEPLM